MSDIHERIPPPVRTIEQIAQEMGRYPVEAFYFVELGLGKTAERLHGKRFAGKQRHHVTGQELCWGLRRIALERWGFLATTVLRRWNITGTADFGRIVFALVQAGLLSKTDEDRLEDFQQVYSFGASMEQAYRIKCG